MNLPRRIITGLAASTMAAGLLVGTAEVAGAAASGDYTGTGVNIRTGPFTNRTSKGQGNPGDRLTATCLAVNGTPVNGNTGWFRHTNSRTGRFGYSSAEFIGISSGSFDVRNFPDAPCTPA
ncbi:hypothetical protein [Actinocrispum wychmicini]|uniref:SH3 domain-containing protein n=1 Tax=Actinocrispum wychmicini TaxID=1213861 RepID=A0A4V2S885_9PSEU|nr:hypothetical protein [Actinocrispum wychmicini]TCO62840.1 hypothetical protein EV192_102979 [Actinocrispum wychmicini]